MTAQERAKHFIGYKLNLIESIDCFTNNFEQLKVELEEALNYVNDKLNKSNN
tara:strand:+ start:1315 stop:1470 length:156 start_codon:yes stop_codon:yes gene_type:complete